jgi:hypothetical protein
LRQDHAQAFDLAHVLIDQVISPDRNMRSGMNRKNGKHFCDRIMFKPMIQGMLGCQAFAG